MKHTIKLAVILCTITATALTIILAFTMERTAINSIFADIVVFFHWFILGGSVFLGVSIIIGLVYAVAWIYLELRNKSSYQVIRPSKGGHKAQAFIGRDGSITRLDLDIETIHQVATLVRQIPTTTVQQIATPNVPSLPSPTKKPEDDKPIVSPPSMEYVVSQLEENALQVCLGVSKETGDPFVMDLVDGTHYRIIGGSGFGKSCAAASILEQVTQTNDPDHLMISLLDLEHKTSRLFEDLPHVAALHVGRRRVDCVATSPDEVAQHFQYLRGELDRRKALSEYDLYRQRFLLIYVEEFLSLKREVDPALKDRMMDDFTILALRGRKYGLYLLACAQVDYSDKSLRDAMNQFNVNMSFSVKPSAARAVGFCSNDLLKENFAAKQRGQFVLETTGCTDIMLAPQYDVKAKLKALERSSSWTRSDDVLDPFTSPTLHVVTGTLNESEPSSQARSFRSERSTEVEDLRKKNWGKAAIIEKLWGVKKGGSPRYKEAEVEYEAIITEIEVQEA